MQHCYTHRFRVTGSFPRKKYSKTFKLKMSKTNGRRRKRGGSRKKKNKFVPNPRPINLAPPMYVSQENRTWMVRCNTNATSTLNGFIRMSDLAGMLGIIATAATTSVFLCDQYRLKRVCVWAPVATAGVPVTVMLKYVDDPAANTQSGAPRTVSDTAISFDRPAYACLEPPKDNSSIFSQWFDSSLTTQILNVVLPVGSTLDFYFNFILDDIGQTSAGPAIVAGTAGNIYHKAFACGAATLTAVAPLNSI